MKATVMTVYRPEYGTSSHYVLKVREEGEVFWSLFATSPEDPFEHARNIHEAICDAVEDIPGIVL